MSRISIISMLLLTAGQNVGGVSAAAEAHGRAVAPGEVFTGPMLKLRAPYSLGWVELGQSPAQIAFGRSGATASDSDIASVTLFKIATSVSDEAFLELIKSGVEKDSPKPRFDLLMSEFGSSHDRPYTCVVFRGKSIDNGRKSLLSRKSTPLELRVAAIYCKYPEQPGLAFTASFSHRGPSVSEAFDDEANAFIEGVQTPARSPPNKSPERTREP